MKKSNKSTLAALCVCGVMLSMSIALSMFKLFELPLGGSVTFASALPLGLLSYRYGLKTGVPAAFLSSLFHLIRELHYLSYAKNLAAVTVIIVFDYIAAFTAVGLAGAFKNKYSGTKKSEMLTFSAGLSLAAALRFLCHFISGAVVWYELTKELSEAGDFVNRAGAVVYSLAYNASYMLPELAVCLAVGVLLCAKVNIARIGPNIM
ncbi:MAG: energy-coupled thiamine transporter ThiT [Oscillospiraceae bacterium]|nr:energy-coupled thiamine transporter ThiT [Oscillospiraceae bacterium]